MNNIKTENFYNKQAAFMIPGNEYLEVIHTITSGGFNSITAKVDSVTIAVNFKEVNGSGQPQKNARALAALLLEAANHKFDEEITNES